MNCLISSIELTNENNSTRHWENNHKRIVFVWSNFILIITKSDLTPIKQDFFSLFSSIRSNLMKNRFFIEIVHRKKIILHSNDVERIEDSEQIVNKVNLVNID